MNNTFIFSLFICFLSLGYPVQAADITGIWKTIDDQTGYVRAEVKISKLKDGRFAGKIIKVHSIPNRISVSNCEKCEGKLKNAPLIGLPILSGFQQNTEKNNEYVNGQILNPLSRPIKARAISMPEAMY